MEWSDADYADVVEWRRDIHAHPELQFEVHRTAAFVAAKLAEFGCDEIITGIGKTGVVGIIHGQQQTSEKVIGLRADMDALPIEEETGAPWVSTTKGVMHACGHDGHTAMLLGAARSLTRTRAFNGKAVVIFQPAEEGGGGGKAMVDDGLMDRLEIDEIYAMHTEPGLPIGQFTTASGPLAASADGFRIKIEGKGAHGASPHVSVDPLVVGANILLALQTIVSRNVHPRQCAVVTVGWMAGGKAGNVIPQSAEMGGTTRTFDPATRDLIEKRVTEIASHVAEAYGAKASVAYKRMFPPTINHPGETVFAVSTATSLVGAENVNGSMEPLMGSEDFAFMLEARPGNIMLIGNGDGPSVHDSRYDFNDAAIPFGVEYFKAIVERGLPLE
ncbi:amidohydrolase [Agrobacterium vitis]|uniref:Amidohydrolase n=2 Tax=Agrobacterium vitis TaxID=373 RepID=A0AAE5AU94_AGRVI|nr:M20 aminoacylase family protein [Agrobacterium vitis]MCF1498596.1 amidohydrolase [Allorhizobium sp. Av2]MCM2438285.1 amidohydrolase [Agrobacterium vitis]MUZ56334.1 amidohydrolase [Agrobacterium vitis]MVA64529.1 amidohydrolase [Agrobacterium vitis]MVA85500.1 amidohydrolase [Agrobacterium vitis]